LKKFKKFDTHLRFLNNPMLSRLINTVGGFFVANKPIIEFVDNDFTPQEKETLTDFFINTTPELIIEILPTLLLFGFCSFYFDKKNLEIKRIDYRNGTLKFKYPKKEYKTTPEFQWFWKYNKGKLQSSGLLKKPDKDVFHYILDNPTVDGDICGEMSRFVELYETVEILENYAKKIEKNKANLPVYFQRNLPSLRNDEYENFQNVSFIRNTDPNELDSEQKRALNLRNVSKRITFFRPPQMVETEELLGRYFRTKNFYETKTRVNENGSNYLEIGELLKPVQLKLTDAGDLLKQKSEELNRLISEHLGIYDLTRKQKSALKDSVRQGGFFLRPVISRLQGMLQKFLTFCFNKFLEFLIKKNKDKEKNEKNKDKTEKGYDLLKENFFLVVNLNPLFYLSESEIKLLSENLDFEIFKKLMFGEELTDVIEQCVKNGEKIEKNGEKIEKNNNEKKKKKKKKKE